MWPIIEFSLAPAGATKDKRMLQFMWCVAALLGEILLVDEKAAIAPIDITNEKKKDMLLDKVDIPDNYTKLGKWLLLSGGSWVFNKANSDVYGRFRIKSTVPVEKMLTRVSFMFSRLGGSKLYKKQNQAMETETPMMLLFVSNGTDVASIQSDIHQLLETALDKIDMNGMMPEESDHMEVPKFTLRLNAPRLSSQTKQNHKAYDYFKDQGKKAYHCKVAKELVPFFKFLGGYAHCLRLEVKYFGKFAKFTETLGNNAPISDCAKLHRCMQGHLNYHLSSTSLVINGIDNLDATEVIWNTISNTAITKVTLQEMLYRIN